MSTEKRIGGERWGMYTLALIFDGIQLITPFVMDALITTVALLVFGMIFIEKGALTVGAGGWLKIAKFVIPLGELVFSNMPGILLTVWIQIKASDINDKILPDVVHKWWGRARLKGDVKDVRKQWKNTRHETKQLKKYAYGKGKRGAQTLARKAGQHAKLAKGKAKRSVASAQRRLSSAKLTK